MNRTAMMFFLLGLATLPMNAQAAPSKPVTPMEARAMDATVRRALSGYEPINAPRELRSLAAEQGAAAVSDALLRLLRDAATPGILRLSALEALGYAPTEAGRAYLHEVLAQLGRPEVADDDRSFTLAAAVRALGSFSATEMPRLAAYLAHGNADVREAAALSLSRCGAPAAEVLPLLQKRLAAETDRGVRETLHTALQSLRR
jgi:hypothetical protein